METQKIEKYKARRGSIEIEFYGKFLKAFSNETPEKNRKFDVWDVHNLYELEQSMNPGNSSSKYLDAVETHEIENGAEFIKFSVMVWKTKEDMLMEFETMYNDEENKLYNEIKKYFEVA